MSGPLVCAVWLPALDKFKALVEFKGCEISNTRGISDFRGILKRRGILNIVKFKRRGISNASKIHALVRSI
ncbi:hypothetical protein [Campylobacter gracilis]|uniref:Uncharacterized protein n=1 Tax=Campylobacter gracilis RM3268 TaxID=553220 RepID=C8PGS8_9BACT|nr:hypothetical protein [Campylobacter gracilis]EEV18316.1 hypothetical protein CAMGR0001_1072 [Campylobacter gracilis RM3268]UEB45323.1 hypothetical protein LK410_10105 [Campylobacter gracilis]